MTPAEEALVALLTADYLASKNPGVDRLKVLSGALYQSRLDDLSADEHHILIAAGELAKMRTLARKLRAEVPKPNVRAVVDALNAAEDVVRACEHIPGVTPLLEDIQRLTAGIK